MPSKKTKSYRVRWEIDVDAKSEKEAARMALEIQRDPNSYALFFDVTDDVASIYEDRIRWKSVDLELIEDVKEK